MDKKKEVEKKTWESPKLVLLGTITDVVRGGGGKLSVTGGDPGEMRKEIGTELGG